MHKIIKPRNVSNYIISDIIINCNGKASNFEEGRQRLRRYARQFQKLGFPIRLTDVKIITVSASHTPTEPFSTSQNYSRR